MQWVVFQTHGISFCQFKKKFVNKLCRNRLAVWRQLPKLILAGSTPVSCSKPRIRAHLAPFLHVRASVIYVLVNSLALTFERTQSATLLLGLAGSIFIRETRIADKGASCALSSCSGFGHLCLSKFPRIGKDAVGGPSFFIYFCPWGLTGCPQPSKIEGGGDYDLCDGRYPSDRP